MAPATPSETFCQKTIQQTIDELRTNPDRGLTSAEVDLRRVTYGTNELVVDDDEPLYMKFIDQLKQPLILLLFASAFISLILNQADNAFSITLAILIVVTVAFVQEYRSEKSLEALNKLVPHYCHVYRDGRLLTVLAQELVPGDLVQFSTGDRIPADVRLTKCNELEVDESNLSGETHPRRKLTGLTATGFASHIPIVERANIVFMGTLVRSGNGNGIVVATGKNTEFGAIWTMMKDVSVKKTPLQLKMEQLGKHLSVMSFVIISVISLIGIWQQKPLLETFTIAVSLAVAAIPEGLPIVVTVTLALGVLRMTKKNAIVKRLPSVESLGAVNVIAADKTGTLTINEMTVTQLFTVSDGLIELTEDGPKADKNVKSSIRLNDVLRKLAQISTLCNNANISGQEYIGQATEVALLRMCQRFSFNDERNTYKRLFEIPFDSERKWMAVQYQTGEETVFFVKGAPETVVEKCTRVAERWSPTNPSVTSLPDGMIAKPLSADAKFSIAAASSQMAAVGLRVLALAFGPSVNELTFVGLTGMSDPPKSGVAQAIGELYASGIRVVMITGDSLGTASNIARRLGIVSSSTAVTGATSESYVQTQALSGSDIEVMSERRLQEVIKGISIFYRTTPKHKLDIVKAFQARGDIVAMTGDGVNDAPALKLADIGIAMGKTGTDVSKEAADMIIIDDDFVTILAAIEEGRLIFRNIQNFLRFQLSTSMAALCLVAAATICGWPTPLNPMQILWINIIMDGPPAQALGTETAESRELMKTPPRLKDAPIITKTLILRVLSASFIIVVGTLYIYRSEMSDNLVTAKDTTMTFTTFVFFDMFNAMSCRSDSKSLFSIGVTTNRPLLYSIGASIVCQLMVIYVPFLQRIFQTEALSASELCKVTLLASTVWIADEMRKLAYLQRNSRKRQYKKLQESV